MTSLLEVAGNAANAASVLLANRNSVHNWWVGIIGCALFGVIFFEARLYADATLQIFFIVASLVGWWAWLRGAQGEELPVRRAPRALLASALAAGVLVAAGYGWLLHRYTDAYAPFVDSAVLALSVLSTGLMMARYYECWWGWLAVTTIAIPLYFSRELHLTAALYVLYWINAIVALVRWRRLIRE